MWTYEVKTYKNLLRNSPENTDKVIKKIIKGQLDIRMGQFAEEELDTELKKKIKCRKVDEIPSEIWKTKFNDIQFPLYNTVYTQNTIEK